MKKTLLLIGIVLVVIGGVLWFLSLRVAKAPTTATSTATTTATSTTPGGGGSGNGGGGGKACTQEAKLCPDGSAVGRTGPNCEFAACPTGGGGGSILPYKSGVRGTVLLGPTCPVERIPPDPQCADKPYATTITVSRKGSNSVFATGKSDAKGVFELSLPPGSYTLLATGGTTLPRCSRADVLVTTNSYITTTISCDTGIR